MEFVRNWLLNRKKDFYGSGMIPLYKNLRMVIKNKLNIYLMKIIFSQLKALILLSNLRANNAFIKYWINLFPYIWKQIRSSSSN